VIVEPVVIHPSPPPPELVQTLDLAGIAWQPLAGVDEIATTEPPDGWTGAVVSLDADPAMAWQVIRALRKRDNPVAPLMILIGGAQLADLSMRDELFDDFCLTPFHPRELEARLRHLLWRSTTAPSGDVVEYGQLALNTETYQATIAGRPLDLTYMEYELLKFLAQHPGKVFTREMLLSRVWGYEYYGGARTVDVHIRRLRAKLGEEHANLIDTVRSVGYRFGQSRWTN
jgi:two-component system, OmpR family, alkaline phosphatase synthesis response regulator PhoP